MATTKPKKKASTDHIVMRNNALFCSHCGRHQALPLPMSIPMFSAMNKAFAKDHKHCEPSWKPPVNENATGRTETENIQWWLMNGEQGLSSKTMVAWLAESPVEGFFRGTLRYHPVDPDDLRRCYLLLQAVPQFGPRIQQMARVSSQWRKLSEHWDALIKLLEEGLGLPDGSVEAQISFRDLTQRMRGGLDQ